MSQLQTPQSDQHARRGGHIGHGLLMLVCCIPIPVIAIVLVATGVASALVPVRRHRLHRDDWNDDGDDDGRDVPRRKVRTP